MIPHVTCYKWTIRKTTRPKRAPQWCLPHASRSNSGFAWSWPFAPSVTHLPFTVIHSCQVWLKFVGQFPRYAKEIFFQPISVPCDLTPKVHHFMPLSHWPLVPICIAIGSFVFKILCLQERTDEWTGWEHNAYACHLTWWWCKNKTERTRYPTSGL